MTPATPPPELRELATVACAETTVSVMVRPASPGQRVIMFPSVGEYPVYQDSMYARFLETPARNETYLAAIRAHAPGRVAVDIGSGRDALWAIACARAGATHVYAVEELPAVAEQARTAVAQAGLADRVSVITGRSTEIDLPHRADLCVSEIIGNIAGAEGAAAVIRDARARLCRGAAVSIPDRAVTTMAAVSLGDAPDSGRLTIASESIPFLQEIFTAVGHPFDVRLCLVGDPAELLISTDCQVERVNFNDRPPPSPSVATGELTITRDARIHGFLLWVRLWGTAGGEVLDTLLVPEHSWVPVYAPVSVAGIEVAAGDAVIVRCAATISDDAVHPDYQLHGTVVRRTGDRESIQWISPHHGRRFRTTVAYRDLFPVAGR